MTASMGKVRPQWSQAWAKADFESNSPCAETADELKERKLCCHPLEFQQPAKRIFAFRRLFYHECQKIEALSKNKLSTVVEKCSRPLQGPTAMNDRVGNL